MKRVIRSSIPFAAAVLLAGCGLSPEDRFARAEKAYAEHEWSAARIDLSSIVQSSPDDAQALQLLARTYIALSDPISAKAILERLDKLGSLPPDAAILQGNVALLNKRFDEVLTAVANDRSAEACRLTALARLGKEERDKAAEAFALGEKAPGEKGRLLADYANFQFASGNLPEARRLAELAARERPRPLNSYLTSGDLLASTHELDKALAVYTAGLKDYPESRAALLSKIRMLDALDKAEEERALVAKGLAANPDDLDLIYFNAHLDAAGGKWDNARTKLQAHEQELEKQPLANALYAKTLLELGQGEQARTRLSSQVLREPGNRQARMLLGETKLKLGDAAGAVETLQPLAQLPNATPEELALLAKAYNASGGSGSDATAQRAREAAAAELMSRIAKADKAIRGKDWQTAIHEYETILQQTDGRNALVLNNLAFAYSETGDTARALGYAERALKQAPDNPSVMDTTGWLLHQTGRNKERAAKLVREAARLAPGNQTIARHLAEIAKS
ncbi:tetratricopeptide repeat protein [Novosphingobium album (ex Hu et al. 2023)]|uniref:Tetratricopeptide repeat protein n=1 Tax=Novosphingobium album (ex Hu et al. 2023) TaxID=2930093 RepID=A0ABT0AX86_9SPHN|nr:tetratricopeptide repeat protein [Novosphingobium album (ex Hu et al. 2023)]MCJ2177442.1 tetratricopeptide repeat protein [Novosphingobium album (ex Hu et al. 2023)]